MATDENGSVNQQENQPSWADAYREPVPWEATLWSGYETLPVRALEVLAVLAGIFCVDFFCYQGAYSAGRHYFLGPSGWAAFFAIMPVIFCIGSRNCTQPALRILLTAGIWLAALKIWFGASLPAAVSATVMLLLLGAEGTGVKFRVLDLLRYGCTSLTDGGKRVFQYFGSLQHAGKSLTGVKFAAILIPLVAVLIFGGIFIMANPLLQEFFQTAMLRLQEVFTYLPPFSEIALWCVAGWLLAGLLLPRKFKDLASFFPPRQEDDSPKRSDSYQIALNTLVAVCVLFAANLVFEFLSVFCISRPETFDYGTYCHQGAAWITFALCLTTVVQACIFTRGIYRDDRVGSLKKWTVLWAVENFLLVVVIYNRLCVYVGLNGLTWLRIVGYLGVTAVALGLFWVLWKVLHRCDLPWLIRRFAVTVAALFYLYSVAPVDTLVHGYNTRTILRGNPGPALHLFMQDISPEGWCQVFPLLECETTVVRQGAAALLNTELDRRLQLRAAKEESDYHSWRDYFYTETRFLQLADTHFENLAAEKEVNVREEARQRLERNAGHWYWNIDSREDVMPVPDE